ncbi:MAG: endo-1,4-beta-xylanase [Treponema sp.]|jgi:GH35 family endo-1,4-beta-xylanase|nr:endo-1,4-beta-xylanase [Treponema sp.]
MNKQYAHRQAKQRLRLIHASGTPLARVTAQARQTQHEFLFGVGGFDAVELAGGKPDGAPLDTEQAAILQERLDRIFALCNYATLPFYWGRYEPEEGKPDERRVKAAATWYAQRGIATKGHPLCWHTVCAPWLMKYSNAEILEKQLARILRDIRAFKGSIERWDVINEVVIMPIFDKYDNAITRVCKELGRVRMVKEVFSAARQANPAATLVLNDFNTSDEYAILVDGCLQAGIPIDVIGIQSHQHQGYWGIEKLHTVLERFSHFGLPIHFTENTIISGNLMPARIIDLNDWQVAEWPSTPEGEERQAREVVEMYETLFAHPLVEAITTWDATDGKWLGAPSGLLRKDNSAKPVYDALMEKIKGEWWTGEQSLTTDNNGELEIEGFRGEYTISLNDKTAVFCLDGKQPVVTLTL